MRVATLLPLLFGVPSLAVLVDRRFPSLIIPLVKSTPYTAYGTQLTGNVSQTVGDLYPHSNSATDNLQRTTATWTEISFDVPVNNARYCRLDFFLNTDPIKNAPLELSGQPPYTFNISRLEPKINKDKDTWNSHPQTIGHAATVTVDRYGRVAIDASWFPCPKGQVAQFLMTPGSKRDLKLEWFELNYRADEGGPHGVVLDMYSTIT